MDLQTQLDLALQDELLHGSHPAVVELFLNAGADPKIMDRQAALNSALQYAIIKCRPAVVELSAEMPAQSSIQIFLFLILVYCQETIAIKSGIIMVV